MTLILIDMWDTAANGFWNDSSNWGLGIPGTSSVAELGGTATYDVASNQSNSVDTLLLDDPNAQLTLIGASANTFSISEPSINDGKISVNAGQTLALLGTGSSGMWFMDLGSLILKGEAAQASLVIGGSVTLAGGGNLTLAASSSGTANNAILSNGSPATLINDGNTISGGGDIGDANLTFANVVGTVEATGVTPLIIYTGANEILNTGSLVAGQGATFIIDGALDNAGSMVVGEGARMKVEGAVTGTGTASIGIDASLEYDNSVAGGQAVSFTGTNGLLVLGVAAQSPFAGTVSGFGSTEFLDFRDVSFTSGVTTVTVSQNLVGSQYEDTLTASNGSQSASVTLLEQYANEFATGTFGGSGAPAASVKADTVTGGGGSFVVEGDQQGQPAGTLVTYHAVSVAA